VTLSDDACYAAVLARDPRFDGVFFVCVSTTGIYCRPICPARTPGRTRVSFHETAAQCEAAGYRACFRCRPELAPGNADVDAVDALVASVTRKINEGALNEASVDDLAAELGVSARHLRRVTEARLGVSPIDLALSRRLGLAKQLLQDTALPITQIAFAAGFRSVRRFNAAFIERMKAAPTKIRRTHAPDTTGASLRLDYRAPYDWNALLVFLRARAVPGVELVGDNDYRRVVHIGGVTGVIRISAPPNKRRATDARVHLLDGTARGRSALSLEVSAELVPHLMPIVARVRRQFDLDARPDVIARVLGADPILAPFVKARPGLRLPGAFDPFEAAIRAMLGQQVSVAGATTLAGRFAAAFGTKFDGGDALTTRFPSADDVANQSVERIAKIGMPGARAAAIVELARAIAQNRVTFDNAHDLDAFVAKLVALPGIGPWTAHYLAMRALHVPDAFPASDLGVKKALDATPRECEERAAAWRPYRSYAVMHLWTSLGDSNDDDDNDERSIAREDDREPGRRATPVRARRRADGRLRGNANTARGSGGKSADPGSRGRAARRVLRG
jgi:AraC family transcriptional regulator of adaptative response / DNA-3-methyladenine glycosylase II